MAGAAGLVLPAALLSFTAACASAQHPVRRSAEEPPDEREIEARARFAEPGCKPALSAFFPGLGQLSCGRRDEGRGLALLAGAELGTALAAGAARGFSSAAAQVPLLAYADLLTASLRCRNGKLKRQLGWQPRFRTYREGIAAILGSVAAAR